MASLTVELLEKVTTPLNGLSPYDIYLIKVDHLQVGTIIYRYGSMDERYIDGHIGYTIEEPYRGHHYAYHATKLLLDQIDHDVIITCEDGNIASQKTIERLGGIHLETKLIPTSMRKYFAKDEKVKRIYLIKKENKHGC